MSNNMQKRGQLWSSEDKEKLKNIILDEQQEIDYEGLAKEFQRNLGGMTTRCEMICKELVEEDKLTREQAISRCQLNEKFIEKLQEREKQRNPEYLKEEKERLKEIILNSEEKLDYESLSKDFHRSIRDTQLKCRTLCKQLIKKGQLTEQQAIEKCQLDQEFMNNKQQKDKKIDTKKLLAMVKFQEKKIEFMKQEIRDMQRQLITVEEKIQEKN